MGIRICIMVDLDSDDPRAAYAMLRSTLAGRVDWESSDEWYRADGEEISAEEISRVRMDEIAGN